MITQTARLISFSAFWDETEPRFSNVFGCSFFPQAPCDLHSKLPTRCSSETKMSRASLLDARSPAVHLQRLGWPLVLVTICIFLQRCSLPPAGFLRTDVRVHHKVTRLPQSGCSHRALKQQQFTRTTETMQALVSRRERTTIPTRRIQYLSPCGCN